MRLRTITLVALVAILAFVPQAFAFSSGGHGHGGGSSASFNGTSFSGASGAAGTGGAAGSGGTLSTPEPFATLLVGLGLLGARFLRRK